MGLSLRNIGKKLWDQVNKRDQGKTWSNDKIAVNVPRAPQVQQRPVVQQRPQVVSVRNNFSNGFQLPTVSNQPVVQARVDLPNRAPDAEIQRLIDEQRGVKAGFIKPKQSLADKLRDIPDANSPMDKYKRNMESLNVPVPLKAPPRNELYMDQAERTGRKFVGNNVATQVGQQFLGHTLGIAKTAVDANKANLDVQRIAGQKERQGSLTLEDRLGAVTANILGSVTNPLNTPMSAYQKLQGFREGNKVDTNKEIKKATARLNKNLDTRNSLGSKSMVSSKELENLSPSDIIKKSTSYGVGSATEILPVTKGYRLATAGKTAVSSLAKNAVGDFATGAAGDATSQFIDTGKIDPKQALMSGAAAVGLGLGTTAAFSGLHGTHTSPDVSITTKSQKTKLQADRTFNAIQQDQNVSKMQKLIEERKNLKENTPEFKKNQLEFQKALHEQDTLVQQGHADELAKIEAERPKVTAKNPVDAQGREFNATTGEYVGTPVSAPTSVNAVQDAVTPLADGERYTTTNADIAFGSDSNGGVVSYKPDGAGTQVKQVSYNQLSEKTRTELITAEQNYARARANSKGPVKPGTRGEIQIAREQLDIAQSNAIEELGLQDYANKVDSSGNVIQKTYNDRYTDWAESKYWGLNPDEREIFAKDAIANPEKYKVQFEAEYRSANQVIAPEPVAPIELPKLGKTPSVVDQADLGTMAKTFYDSKRGNSKITFNELKDLGERVALRLDQSFKDIGSDFETVAKKTQEAAQNGAKSLDEVDLTPNEKTLWTAAQSEMDYMRRRASLGKRKISEGDFGELYFPHQKPGTYPTSDSLFNGFRTEKPGNEFSRGSTGGKLGLDEITYSPDVIASYVTRYGDTKALQQERITRTMLKQYPDANPEKVRIAADKVIDLQDRVNRLETKITLAGTGRKVTTVDGVTGAYIDIPDEMAKIGKDMGRKQVDVGGTTHGFTNGERINSVDISENGVVHTVGDYTGLNQHRDASTYAGMHTLQAGKDRVALANLVGERLQENYRLAPDDIQYALESITRMKEGLPEEVVRDHVNAIYRNAAKQQLMDSLQSINIKDKTLRKDVSDLTQQILREGSIEQKVSSKVVNGIMRTTNAIFRKFNVSSALNELSDLTSFMTVYGKGTKVFTPDFKMMRDMGLAEVDPAIDSYLRQVESGVPVRSVLNTLKKANDISNLYRFVEHYKAGVLVKSAHDLYSARGLSGDALTAQILKDYRNLALPQDAFTKTFLNNAPLYTQYMPWGARNIQKEFRLATGQIDAGVMADKSMGQRIARDIYVNLPAKTAFWLASNGLKGTAILTAFGLTDFTGMTNADYSGIQEEDRSVYDKTTQFTNQSTTGSILNTIVQGWEKEQLKKSDKYKNADYNPYEQTSLKDDAINLVKPQQVKNAAGAWQLQDQGFSQNKAGRVQFEAPTDNFNKAKSFVFGKNQTAEGRKYTGNTNVVERVKSGDNVVKAVTDMAKEQVTLKDRNYTRPISKEYSDKYKSIDKVNKDARTAMLQGGRKYNKYMDDLKKNKPEYYNSYIKSMDGNHVNPEYWRNISQGDNGGSDLTTFKMIANRKKQLSKDLGTPYDPTYDLPDDQASALLQYKSTATGDNIPLRNTLNKEQWYQDYKKKVSEYFDKQAGKPGSDFKETKRVKDWNTLDDQLNSFYMDSTSKTTPEWSKRYPLVYQQKQINNTYGFDSPQSKNFFKGNAGGYQAQKDAMAKEQLGIINKMRKIEGYPEMSWDAYQQATKFADTSGSKKSSGYGSGSGGGGSSSKNANPYKYAVSLNAGKVSLKGKIKVPIAKATKSAKKYVVGKPKVTSKKSSV